MVPPRSETDQVAPEISRTLYKFLQKKEDRGAGANEEKGQFYYLEIGAEQAGMTKEAQNSLHQDYALVPNGPQLAAELWERIY